MAIYFGCVFHRAPFCFNGFTDLLLSVLFPYNSTSYCRITDFGISSVYPVYSACYPPRVQIVIAVTIPRAYFGGGKQV